MIFLVRLTIGLTCSTLPIDAQIPALLDSAQQWMRKGEYRKICDIKISNDEIENLNGDSLWHALGDLYTQIGVALAQFALRDSAIYCYQKSIRS